MFTRIKTEKEIVLMRQSGRMLASILQLLRQKASVGMSTKQLADIAATELKKLGGKPAFLGYQGFPDVLCTSVNDEVVHGIPRPNKFIREGDILSLDFGVDYRGMITDAATSFIVGQGLRQHERLIKVTEQAMYAGIDVVRGGIRTGDIGHAVEIVLHKQGYGIVRDLVGHGVGHELHEDPNVPNYGAAHTGAVLQAGMTIAIEPMATLGKHRVIVADDSWTILTADGSWSAHFEHTILITEHGSEVLTRL